ncbi:MAG: (2Fe-2S) ferredoxin domain-containing protein [Cyanobacteria bacterium J06560_6]
MSNIILNTMSDIVSDINLDPIPETKPLSPWMFNLEGIFIGFLGDDPKQIKSIVIEVEQEQLTIRLPKKLRTSVRRSIKQRFLKPGDRLRCVGRSRLDFSTGVVELTAYCLFAESANGDSTPKDLTYKASTYKDPLNVGTDLAEKKTSPYSAKQSQAKVLICHKSGCKKRGGRQLVAALNQILESYELQNQVEIQYTGCQKRCSKAPSLTIVPGNYHYDRLTLSSLSTIVEKHFC